MVAAAAGTGWIVATIVPPELRPPSLHDGDFRIARPADQPLELGDGRWLLVPFRFPDFDLRMDLELAPGVEVDLLCRLVEPRLEGAQMLPFAGRFGVLRLSTTGDGPGFRSRDEAVLGPRGSGVGVAPGMPASVWIEGRGRQLVANVAGRKQAPFLADDEYGMFALVARGGAAVVRSLLIENRGWPAPWRHAPWLWAGVGALCGVLVAALAWRRGATVRWFLVAGVPMVVLAAVVRARADLDLAFPPAWALAAVLGGCVLVALAQVGGGLVRVALATVGLAGLAAADRALRHDTAAIDAVFGPDAGSQISEAHAQLVRGPAGLQGPQRTDPCVFLLGGQLLYDRGPPEQHMAQQTLNWLRSSLGRHVQVVAAPTVDGHVAQQWRLFTTCYAGFRPRVVVLGVPRDEMAIGPAGTNRSSSAQVRDTIAAARAWCEGNAARLVVFADDGLPRELLEVVRSVAREGIVVVEMPDGGGGEDGGRRLAAAIEPLLQS